MNKITNKYIVLKSSLDENLKHLIQTSLVSRCFRPFIQVVKKILDGSPFLSRPKECGHWHLVVQMMNLFELLSCGSYL